MTGRIPLFFNSDIVMGVVRPAEAMPETRRSTATARPTSCSTSTRASGLLDTVFGPIRYGPGDYLVLPIGTTWRLAPGRGQRAADALPRVPVGDRAAEALPQRLRPAPRALAVLAARHPAARRRPATDRRGRLPRPRQDARPADRLPLPAPPVRRRRLGWLPLAVRLQHRATSSRSPGGSTSRRRSTRRSRRGTSSCARSCRASSTTTRWRSRRRTTTRTSTRDEVIYYVAGNFMSRRGVGISSFTLHPAGIPHGPHPGTAEASIGKEATEELAVMVDTFHPLRITKPGGRPRGRPLPVFVAAGRGRPRRGPRAQRARAGGVPGLRVAGPSGRSGVAGSRRLLAGRRDRREEGFEQGACCRRRATGGPVATTAKRRSRSPTTTVASI